MHILCRYKVVHSICIILLIDIIKCMALRAPQTPQCCLTKKICVAQSMISFCELSSLQEKGIKSFYDLTNRGFGPCF